jgi:hypothetical protein
MVGQAIIPDFMNNMRPMSQPQVSNFDFLRGKQRMQEFQRQSSPGGYMESTADYLRPKLGKGADNPYVRQVYDALDPRGSQAGAFQMAYANFGNKLTSNLGGQGEASKKLLDQVNKAFTENGKRSAMKSFGMDDAETMDALDAGLRYGIGGLSNKKLADAVKNKKAGGLAAANNEIFAAASDTFGKDKTKEELAQLMNQTSDDFRGLDPNQATQLLTKISATSRAIGISSEAFVKYSDMLKQMYESVGVSGSQALRNAPQLGFNAKRIAEVGAATGDTSLTDVTKNMDTQAQLSAKFNSSQEAKMVVAVGSLIQQTTAEEGANLDLGGDYGTLAQQRAIGEDGKSSIQRRLDSGDADEIMKFNRALDKAMNGAVSSKATHLVDSDYKDANKAQDMSKMSRAIQGNEEAKRIAGLISKSGDIDDGIMAKIGKTGVDKIMGDVQSIGQGRDAGAVRKIIEANLKESNLSEEEKDKLSGQFARSFGDASALGSGTEAERNAKLAGRKINTKEDEKQAQQSADMETYLRKIAGDSMTPLKLKEIVDMGLSLTEDINKGNGVINGAQVKDKNGKIDFEALKKVGGKYLGIATRVEENKKLMEAMSPEETERISKVADKAYNKTLKETGDMGKASSARAEAIKGEANKFRKANEGQKGVGASTEGMSDQEKEAFANKEAEKAHKETLDATQDKNNAAEASEAAYKKALDGSGDQEGAAKAPGQSSGGEKSDGIMSKGLEAIGTTIAKILDLMVEQVQKPKQVSSERATSK